MLNKIVPVPAKLHEQKIYAKHCKHFKVFKNIQALFSDISTFQVFLGQGFPFNWPITTAVLCWWLDSLDYAIQWPLFSSRTTDFCLLILFWSQSLGRSKLYLLISLPICWADLSMYYSFLVSQRSAATLITNKPTQTTRPHDWLVVPQWNAEFLQNYFLKGCQITTSLPF